MTTVDWNRTSDTEWRAKWRGHSLWVTRGVVPGYDWYQYSCFKDRAYIGLTWDFKDAEELCMSDKKVKTFREELDTLEEDYKALGKSKPAWNWLADQGRNKDQWLADPIPEEESCAPRIRKLDEKTFCCYRDGRYLGGEDTLERAQMRCAVNKISEFNRVMKLWEKNHPGELPPFLQLTEGERAEYWRRNPPKARPAGAPPPRAKRPGGTGVPGGAGSPESGGGCGGATGAGGEKNAPRGRAGRSKPGPGLPGSAVLARLGDKPNPKKPGSAAAARWAKLFDHAARGSTVDAFAADGGNLETLENAVKQGYVKVEEK